MFISRGQTAPRGQSFDVNRYVLSLHSFVASLKKTSLKSDFIQFFFSWLNTCSPSAGAERPQGTKFWCHQKGLITFLICCKFQRNLFEVWFYTIVFMINTCMHFRGRGQNFDVNRKALSLYPLVANFKEISLKSDFIQLCSWFNTCI